MLVDGYNVIFAWDDLKELAKENIEAARNKLMDVLCNYQGFKNYPLILVFDAYKVEGEAMEIFKYHNIHVVYTKEAETADMYIEKVVHEVGRKYHVTVVTSDGVEQVITQAGRYDHIFPGVPGRGEDREPADSGRMGTSQRECEKLSVRSYGQGACRSYGRGPHGPERIG